MDEIGLKRYRLLFYGNVVDEADPVSAKSALAERYALAGAKLDACFSGRKVALHSDLSERDAYRIQSELEDHGLITHLELLEHTSHAATPEPEPLPRAVFTTPTHDQRTPLGPHDSSHTLPTDTPPQTPTNVSLNQEKIVLCQTCLNILTPIDVICPNCGAINPALINPPTKRSKIMIKAVLIGLALIALVAGATWLALPVYQQQKNHALVRSAISEVEGVSDQLRTFIDKTGFWPNSNLDAGLGEPDSFQSSALASIRISSKALIIATFNDSQEDIGGQTLLFVPQRSADRVVHWRCDGGTLAPQWRPTECIAPEHTEYQRQDTAAPLTLAESIPKIPASTNPTGPSERKIQQLLRNEISKTVHVRQAVMQMRIMDGLWPRTNSEAGLPVGRLISSSAFHKVEVQPEGRILYVFSDQIPSFEGHKLWLVPAAVGEWRCEASFEERYLPTPCSASISH
jgi:pilin